MRRWIALAPLVVLALLAVLFAGYGLRHDPTVYPAALVGKRLPDLARRAVVVAAARVVRDGPPHDAEWRLLLLLVLLLKWLLLLLLREHIQFLKNLLNM